MKYELSPCPSAYQCLNVSGIAGTPEYEETCCPLCFGIGQVPAVPNPAWPTARALMSAHLPLDERRESFDAFLARKEEEDELYGQLAAEPEEHVREWLWGRLRSLPKNRPTDLAYHRRRAKALAILKRGTTESWGKIRTRIWVRDRLDEKADPQRSTL